MSTTKKASLFQKDLIKEALKHAFIKLNPKTMIKNPVMFTVEIGTFVMFLVLCNILFYKDTTQGSFGYNLFVFIILFLTLLFANFAEAIAEARGKAQAESLRKTREETPAKLINPVGELYVNEIQIVSSSQLKKGDVFLCEAGDIIATDGEIIEGLATIDEIGYYRRIGSGYTRSRWR